MKKVDTKTIKKVAKELNLLLQEIKIPILECQEKQKVKCGKCALFISCPLMQLWLEDMMLCFRELGFEIHR